MSDSDKKVTEGELIPALGNIVKQKITRPKELFLLFWVDEFDQAREFFEVSAKTRFNNIKNSFWYQPIKHVVKIFPILSFDELPKIISQCINKYGGNEKVKVAEIGIFSHSGLDGPIIYDNTNQHPLEPNRPIQMKLEGWNKICTNWTKNARCIFYGCNSANENYGKNFAQNVSNLSNFKNVEVIGQATFSYPSFVPDYRITSIARSMPMFLDTGWEVGWDSGATYMVGGRENETTDVIKHTYKGLAHNYLNAVEKGLKEMQKSIGIETEEITSDNKYRNYVTAEPMNFYKNGIKISSTHQGVFNDHRKNKK